jgi:hypothetical protein
VNVGHDRYLELAATALDFELAPAESATLAAHLAACARCRREAAEILGDARALRRLSDGVPSPIVRERVLAKDGPRRRHGLSPLTALAAAAAIVLAVVGGLSAGAFLQASRDDATAAKPDWSRVVPAAGFPAGPGSSGILAIASVPGMGGVHLVAIGNGAGDGRVWTSPDGVAWTREPSTGLEAARPFAVGAQASRLIAVGNEVVGGDSVATAWISTDSRRWDAMRFGGSTGLTAVAASPARIIVAGSARSGGGLPIWSSRDGGRTWQQADQTTPYTRANVSGVALGGPGFVAVGYDDVGAVAWTSTDGLHWRRVDDPSFSSGRMMAVASAPAGLVAVGGNDHGAIAWMSLDGVAWSASRPFGTSDAWPISVAATAYGLVAVGGVQGTERVWTSEDGHEWQAIQNGSVAAAGGIDAVTAHGSLVLIAGSNEGHALLWLGRPLAEER